MFYQCIKVLPIQSLLRCVAQFVSFRVLGQLVVSPGVVDTLKQGANTLRKVVLKRVDTRISRMLINIDEHFMFILVIRILFVC